LLKGGIDHWDDIAQLLKGGIDCWDDIVQLLKGGIDRWDDIAQLVKGGIDHVLGWYCCCSYYIVQCLFNLICLNLLICSFNLFIFS
jgi:hypothetical protein